jgi:hypothetical protein
MTLVTNAVFQVTFLTMPLEIGWNATLTWKAGDAMCRMMSFFRAFALYLFSFVIVCISLERSVVSNTYPAASPQSVVSLHLSISIQPNLKR